MNSRIISGTILACVLVLGGCESANEQRREPADADDVARELNALPDDERQRMARVTAIAGLQEIGTIKTFFKDGEDGVLVVSRDWASLSREHQFYIARQIFDGYAAAGNDIKRLRISSPVSLPYNVYFPDGSRRSH